MLNRYRYSRQILIYSTYIIIHICALGWKLFFILVVNQSIDCNYFLFFQKTEACFQSAHARTIFLSHFTTTLSLVGLATTG